MATDWTATPPTKPDHYWWRRNPDGQALPMRLDRDGRAYDTYGGSTAVERLGGEWGPRLDPPGTGTPATPAEALARAARALEDAAQALRALAAGAPDWRADP